MAGVLHSYVRRGQPTVVVVVVVVVVVLLLLLLQHRSPVEHSGDHPLRAILH